MGTLLPCLGAACRRTEAEQAGTACGYVHCYADLRAVYVNDVLAFTLSGRAAMLICIAFRDFSSEHRRECCLADALRTAHDNLKRPNCTV